MLSSKAGSGELAGDGSNWYNYWMQITIAVPLEILSVELIIRLEFRPYALAHDSLFARRHAKAGVDTMRGHSDNRPE